MSDFKAKCILFDIKSCKHSCDIRYRHSRYRAQEHFHGARKEQHIHSHRHNSESIKIKIGIHTDKQHTQQSMYYYFYIKRYHPAIMHKPCLFADAHKAACNIQKNTDYIYSNKRIYTKPDKEADIACVDDAARNEHQTIFKRAVYIDLVYIKSHITHPNPIL